MPDNVYMDEALDLIRRGKLQEAYDVLDLCNENEADDAMDALEAGDPAKAAAILESALEDY